MIDDVLLNKKHETPRKKRLLPKIFIGLLLVIAVLGGILSFADIGGDTILGLAEDYIRDNYKLELTAEKITGNPVKGYTLENFTIRNDKGEEILSAGYLFGRVNFSALTAGNIRLAELALGGLNTNIEQLMDTAQKLNLTAGAKFIMNNHVLFCLATPAYADDINTTAPDIPLDKFTLKDSHITSQYGTVDINDITADLRDFTIALDAAVNGIPLKGTVDLDESSGLTAIDSSALTFGSGKITATGGLINGNLDVHATIDGLDLKEITALYPEVLTPRDYDGTVNINAEISGNTDSPKLTGMLDYKGKRLAGYPVEMFSANMSYANYRAGLSNIQANLLSIPVQGEIGAAHRPGENISILVKLDGREASLEGLDKVFDVPELRGLTGKVDAFSANISGHLDELSGLVNFSAPRIAYDGRALTNIRAQLKMLKSDKAQVDGKFMFEGAQGYLSGTVSSVLLHQKLDISAKLVDLDVKRVQNMIPDASDYKLAGKITASVNVKGGIDDPVVSGALNSPEFSGFDQKITKPAINFTYDKKTLTLTKAEGTLNGMPINIGGTVSPLPSANPNVNINATITLTPSALKAYVPDIDQYKIKGSINAGIKVQGSANNPSINLLASSKNIQAMDMLTARDMELTTALDGDLAKLDKIDINASAKSVTVQGVTVTDIGAKLNKDGDKITLSSLGAKSGSGSLTGSGSATVSGKEPLNFSFVFKNLAVGVLASYSGVDMKGSLSGALRVSGQNTNPSVSFTANIPKLTAQGFTFTNMAADISGSLAGLKLNTLRAEVEGAELSASGTVQVTPSVKANVSVNGKNIKLEKLLKDNPDLKDNISGTVNLTFNVSGTDKGITGKGSATSPALNLYGLKLSNVNLPLSYTLSNNTFASTGGTAKLYGGTLKNSLTFNIGKMTFTDNIDASGVNVNTLIQDVSGGIGGKITGTGKLTMKVNGAVKDKVTYSGSGNFSMGAGAITGFKWVDLATRLYGSKGISYANVSAPLVLQTGKLIIKSGSIVNANKNDKLYKYAKLTQDGAVNFSGREATIYFVTEENVNYQLVSVLQGSISGGLQSLVSGMKNAGIDYRTVGLKITGKAASPSYSLLNVGGSTMKSEEKKAVEQATAKVKEKAAEKVSEAKTKAAEKVSAAKDKAASKVTSAVKKQTSSGQKNAVNKVKNEAKKKLGGLFK